MEHADERFVMHPGELQLVADDGRLISGEDGSDCGGECDEVPDQVIIFEQYQIERILERGREI